MFSLSIISAGPSVPQKKDRPPGEALYRKYRCISCHGSKGTGPFNLTDSRMEFTYDNLRKYIDNPGAFGNQQMPSFEGKIPEKDYKDMIDYVIKLKNDAAKK